MRLYLSLGFLSAAVIAFQLSWMQLLSIVQWHHFAYMIISMALLGFGAAGTFLAFFRRKLLKNIDQVLPLLMISSGIFMSLSLPFSQSEWIRFDSFLLFTPGPQIFKLTLTYLVLFIPIFLAALAVGLLFIHHADKIGKIYASNLIGSGAGGLLVLLLMWWISPNQQNAVISFLPIMGGLLLSLHGHKNLITISGILGLVLSLFYFYQPHVLILSEFKHLSYALRTPDSKIIHQSHSPYGIIQLVGSPSIRYAPGLSLAYQGIIPATPLIFKNGNQMGPLSTITPDSTSFINFTTQALPFQVVKPASVMVLGAGTGIDISLALQHQAQHITAIESDPTIFSLVRENIQGSIPPTDIIHWQLGDPRSFLYADTGHYQLITMPTLGALGGTAGLNALGETFLLTQQAFDQLWEKLTTDGILSINCWMDYPPRHSLKVLATVWEMLEKKQVEQPLSHLVMVRSWGSLNYMIKKSPFNQSELNALQTYCEERFFDPVLLARNKDLNRTRFNQLQDPLFLDNVDLILGNNRASFYRSYPFNIAPASDDKPYFSQFLKLSNLPQIAKDVGTASFPFMEIGYMMVYITLGQVLLLSLIFILLPLFRLGVSWNNKPWIILHFSGIGLGYICLEMVIIYSLSFYFGNPLIAASVTISAILIFSGIGSYLSEFFHSKLRLVLVATLLIIVLYTVLFKALLILTINANLIIKALTIILMIGPLAFLMGIPFPVGISLLSKDNASAIPWAWGVNGCFSVISTALATILAVEGGHFWVFMVATFAYLITLLASFLRK